MAGGLRGMVRQRGRGAVAVAGGQRALLALGQRCAGVPCGVRGRGRLTRGASGSDLVP